MLRLFNIRCILRCPKLSYSTANTTALNFSAAQDSNESTKLKDPESKLVAAAFASLREISAKSKEKRSSGLSESVDAASDMNSLLSNADQPALGKYHAFKIVSTLSEWARDGKIKLNDFATDPRFIRLCRILGRPASESSDSKGTDLSIVLEVTRDIQAVKLISSIDLSQMLKILSNLSLKKRRSTPLLRSLAHQISNSSEKMNIKEASDVFYACASLTYPDDILLQKTTEDILLTLKNNNTPSVVNSLIKSIGILKYRDSKLLNAICDWIVLNKNICGYKEFSNLLRTLASVNYRTDNLNQIVEIIQPFIEEKTNIERIDVVWALIIFDKCDVSLLQSVLTPDFIQNQSFQEGIENYTYKLKLLNINAYAKQLGSQYKGPFLDEEMPIFNVPLSRSKDKQAIFDLIVETLGNLVTISDHVRLDVDRKMGFLIDVEFFIDSKCNIVRFNETDKENSKVAVMIVGYHDVCRGCNNEITGVTALSQNILQKNGYKVLSIPYYELSAKDKLMTRVHYIGQKLKTLDVTL